MNKTKRCLEAEELHGVHGSLHSEALIRDQMKLHSIFIQGLGESLLIDFEKDYVKLHLTPIRELWRENPQIHQNSYLNFWMSQIGVKGSKEDQVKLHSSFLNELGETAVIPRGNWVKLHS